MSLETTDEIDHADSSSVGSHTLVSFTKRFGRNQLAEWLKALISGSMTLSAAHFRCVTRFLHATE